MFNIVYYLAATAYGIEGLSPSFMGGVNDSMKKQQATSKDIDKVIQIEELAKKVGADAIVKEEDEVFLDGLAKMTLGVEPVTYDPVEGVPVNVKIPNSDSLPSEDSFEALAAQHWHKKFLDVMNNSKGDLKCRPDRDFDPENDDTKWVKIFIPQIDGDVPADIGDMFELHQMLDEVVPGRVMVVNTEFMEENFPMTDDTPINDDHSVVLVYDLDLIEAKEVPVSVINENIIEEFIGFFCSDGDEKHDEERREIADAVFKAQEEGLFDDKMVEIPQLNGLRKKD